MRGNFKKNYLLSEKTKWGAKGSFAKKQTIFKGENPRKRGEKGKPRKEVGKQKRQKKEKKRDNQKRTLVRKKPEHKDGV